MGKCTHIFNGFLLLSIVSIGLVSCKDKDEKDVSSIIDDITMSTLQKITVRSGIETIKEEKLFKITQCEFSENGEIIYSTLSTGDGKPDEIFTKIYNSYKLGEYGQNSAGRDVLLYADNESDPFVIQFINNGFHIENQPFMGGTSERLNTWQELVDSFVNRTWYVSDTSFYNVTLFHYDTILTPVTKRGQVIRVDTAIKTIYEKVPVGPREIITKQISLNRSNEFVNTGSWYSRIENYGYDKKYDTLKFHVNDEITVKSDILKTQQKTKDSLSQYDFNWYFETFNDLASFSIHAVPQGDGEKNIAISYKKATPIKGDTVPSVTVEKKILTIKSEIK